MFKKLLSVFLLAILFILSSGQKILLAATPISLIPSKANISPNSASIEPKGESQISEKLSGQTKKILDSIYNREAEISQKYKKKSKVTLDRANPNLSSINLAGYETANGKFNIKIKKPGATLQKKYQIYDKANAALASSQYETALMFYDMVLKKFNDKDENALFGIAVSYHKLGDLTLAKSYYAKTIALYPNNQYAIGNFLVLVAEESPKEALSEFLKLDQVSGRNPSIKAQISYLYAKREIYDSALDYIQQALRLSKGNPTYLYNKAVILDHLGASREAKEIYGKILTSGAYSVIGVPANQIRNRISKLGA